MVDSTSWLGIKNIAAREACVLVAYPDSTTGGDRYSFGFGSKAQHPEDTITITDAFVRLKADIATRDVKIGRFLTEPILQQEWDALASLYFQAGTAALASVATAYNLVSPKDRILAALEFAKWPYGANGINSPGHAKRRIREMAIAAWGDYGDLDTFPCYDGDPRRVTPRAVPFPNE